MADDPATVLEQFIHDVANLPAEVQHLLEEVEAKDKIIADCRTAIAQRDNAIQRHIKTSGTAVKHPKEEQYNKTVMANFEKAQALQSEKCALVEKAALLLDRHVKRLDLKIRDLQSEGSLNIDPPMPSLLVDSPANLVPPVSASSTGVNTPLHSSAMMHGSTNIANAAMLRMLSVNTNTASNRASPGVGAVAGLAPHPLLNSNTAQQQQRQREMSASATSEGKRRKLNATLGTLPTPSATLGRASSLGPGTPKAQTPGSRAASAGPRTKKPSKLGSSQQSQSQELRKKLAKGTSKKKGARIKGMKGSPSTTDNESALSEVSNSDDDTTVRGPPGTDGAVDEEYAEEEGYGEDNDDGQVYCTCRSKGEGDMVACDNQKCEIEWFHFACVGLTQIPKGTWLCPVCRTLDKSKVKIAKD